VEPASSRGLLLAKERREWKKPLHRSPVFETTLHSSRTNARKFASSCVTISEGSIRIAASPHRSMGSSRVGGTRDCDFIPRLSNERRKEGERESERDICAGPRLTADSERRCSARNAQTSRPVNRSTHYHKCPRRARPTRKSVSQIARVGLCHLSRPGPLALLRSALLRDARSPRFHGAKRSDACDRIAPLALPFFVATRTELRGDISGYARK